LEPKPAYVAYQNLCSVFDDRYKPTTVKTTIKVSDHGSFYGVGGEDDAFPSIPLVASFKSKQGKSLLAYWLPWHPQETIREARVDIVSTDLEFEQPVLVNLLDGKVCSIASSSDDDGRPLLKDVPLADFPYIIAERSEVVVQ
jgi:hypothetical protein